MLLRPRPAVGQDRSPDPYTPAPYSRSALPGHKLQQADKVGAQETEGKGAVSKEQPLSPLREAIFRVVPLAPEAIFFPAERFLEPSKSKDFPNEHHPESVPKGVLGRAGACGGGGARSAEVTRGIPRPMLWPPSPSQRRSGQGQSSSWQPSGSR